MSTPEQNDASFDENFKPVGTWAFVIGFAVLLFVLWFYVYFIVLSGGATT